MALAAPEWLGAPPTEPVRRIVSLAPSVTETLFALGAGARVVGVTRFDDEPAAVRGLPRVGGFVDPDPEAVLALTPDVVVAVSVAGARGRLETLARLGVRVLVLPGETLDDLWSSIATLAQLVGAEARGRDLTHELRGTLNRLEAAAKKQPTLSALIVVGYRPLVTAGPGSFLNQLLRCLNARNVVERGGAFAHLDLEAVLAANPDVIIDVAYGEGTDPQEYWRKLPGLGAKVRLERLGDEAILRPGPRLGLGMQALARALRP